MQHLAVRAGAGTTRARAASRRRWSGRGGRRPRSGESPRAPPARQLPASANRSRRRLLDVSARTSRPVSASTSHRSPTSGSSCSRRSSTSTARTWQRLATWRSSRRQSSGPRKSETRTTSERRRATRADAGERLSERRGPDRLLGRLGPDGVQEPEQAGPALARRERPRRRIAERDHAEPVAVAGGRVADRVGDSLGDVCLSPLAGPERHRERRVEDQPGRQGSLGDLHADVRLTGARGDVPVDEADVVPGHVRTDLRELGAGTERGRSVLSGEEPVDPSSQRELERAQQLLGHRPRARAGGGARRCEGHAASRPRSIWGSGTAARTASSRVSGVTPSASAS